MSDTPWDAIATALVCMVIAAGAWVWQSHVQATQPKPVATEPWQHVKEQLPMPSPLEDASAVSTDALQAVVQANPFSPLRRNVPKPAESEANRSPSKPAAPVFSYKGRVVMGTKQRGILEDAQQKKTFFVQAGQDVAGFNVKEITEDHVVLTNLQTKEELMVGLASKIAPEPKEEKTQAKPKASASSP